MQDKTRSRPCRKCDYQHTCPVKAKNNGKCPYENEKGDN